MGVRQGSVALVFFILFAERSGFGAVAQLVARFVRIEEVRGSIPRSSTIEGLLEHWTRSMPAIMTSNVTNATRSLLGGLGSLWSML